MKHIVQRTCSEIGEDGSVVESGSTPQALDVFRECNAYVLLGAPGTGKTEAFDKEAKITGGIYFTAREFIRNKAKPEWRQSVLFIDGLDEVRAGSLDGRQSLDAILVKLEQLQYPRFRLSCREADWLGSNDRSNLKQALRGSDVNVLRLDPLSVDDIRDILTHESRTEDPDGFIVMAGERGVENLLTNPLILRMLAGAVASGNWPQSRIQTFELACKQLLVEYNEEHQIAKPNRSDIPHLLEKAGRLCAIQLLTGSAGYALFRGGFNHEYLGLEQLQDKDREALREVLNTNLFKSPSEVHRIPNHRHIAEFLAGRYLAGLIKEGLPTRRVLALMTGEDGVVVSELRGLSAWLAAHSRPSRIEVIERDPLGTVLYGDVRGFSIDEKRKILNCLRREARGNPWFLNAIALDSRLGDLVTPDMAEAFRDILSGSLRDDAHQSFVVLLINVLEHGEVLHGISDLLLKVIKDDQWWPGIRGHAVSAFIRQQKDHVDDLKALLSDVSGGVVPDHEDDLLGRLLAELYPATLSPTEILQFLRSPKKPNYCPQYKKFWFLHVLKNSTPPQIAEILDGFVAQYQQLRVELRPGQAYRGMHQVPVILLSRFLETSNEEVELDRLFDWLGVASWVGDQDHDFNIKNAEAKSIHCWLSGRPEVQKSLIEMGLEHCISLPESTSPAEFSMCIFMEERRRFCATPGPDFGAWYLREANDATDQRVAEYFIRKIADFVHSRSQNESLSRRDVSKHIAGDKALLRVFNNKLDFLESHEKNFHDTHRTRERQDQRKWHDSVKPHQAALRENRAQPMLLYKLATAYLGGFDDVRGDTPQERMRQLLGSDKKLIDAVLQGFRGSITRHDLPSDTEIISLRANNQVHPLAYPFMAGLEELARTVPVDEISLDGKQRRLALAIHYNFTPWISYTGSDAPLADWRLGWYKLLLTSHPEVVSDVLVRSARSKFRNGQFSLTELYRLAFDRDHAGVARLATLPLLKAFPVHSKARHLSDLSYLLRSALLHCDEKEFLNLIETKLDRRSMTIAQRIYWLTAGLLASPNLYRDKLESYALRNERRVRNLANFVTEGEITLSLKESEVISVLQLLIRVMGPSYRPYDPISDKSEEGATFTLVLPASTYVQSCIYQLASLPSNDALEAFDALLADDSLSHWRIYLKNAADKQRRIRRESMFHHPPIDQVLQTLVNWKPANAADLAALTFDYLSEISGIIRNGNASDWRQYWNVDSYNRPQKPKPEDACRDALLSDLRLKLGKLDIDVQPEGHYADDKQSDIRVYYGGFNAPVEIKRNCHQELWSAIRSQLIAKYTRDPGADGYGIYLVFWFGKEFTKKLGPSGRPSDAGELENQLSNSLTEIEARKISICVIDVSKPS